MPKPSKIHSFIKSVLSADNVGLAILTLILFLIFTKGVALEL